MSPDVHSGYKGLVLTDIVPSVQNVHWHIGHLENSN